MITIIGTILFFVLGGTVLWTFNEMIWGDRVIEVPQTEIAPKRPDEYFSRELKIIHLAQPRLINHVTIDPKNFSL
jgi:hypothetical protein